MKETINAKKWSFIVVGGVLFLLIGIALMVIVIDPFLHYHKPVSFLEYPLLEERYINDGIARHYEYQGIITGSSTSQNFKASQVETLFNVATIKQTYAGGTFYEVSNGLRRAFSYNDDINTVIWGLDLTRLGSDAYEEAYDGIPTYMYDNNIFNDVSYLFNLDVLRRCVNVINYTKSGQKTPSMDDYCSWYEWAEYGRENVLSGTIDYSTYTEEAVLTDEIAATITENIINNIVNLAKENPDVNFYLFYTPMSAVAWYGVINEKQLNYQIDILNLVTSLLLEQDNIHLFDFADNLDVTTNLDNYMDTMHYSEQISELILTKIHDGDGELQADNYKAYYDKVKKLYADFEYDYE